MNDVIFDLIIQIVLFIIQTLGLENILAAL